MKKQIVDNIYRRALYTDHFSKDEIADAYELCTINQETFLSNNPQGERLRREVLTHFKQLHPNCKTIEQLAIQADLDNDIDVKIACILKINAQQYAEALIDQKI